MGLTDCRAANALLAARVRMHLKQSASCGVSGRRRSPAALSGRFLTVAWASALTGFILRLRHRDNSVAHRLWVLPRKFTRRELHGRRIVRIKTRCSMRVIRCSRLNISLSQLTSLLNDAIISCEEITAAFRPVISVRCRRAGTECASSILKQDRSLPGRGECQSHVAPSKTIRRRGTTSVRK